MMASTYTLHVPRHALPGDPEALERATLVRDGFSWGAFLTPALWFLWHRHWVAGIAMLLVTFGFAAGLRAFGVSLGATLAAETLLQLLIGLEGASIRRWLYARRGRPAVELIQANSAEEAEIKGFARWLSDERGTSVYAGGAGSRAPVFGFGRDAEPVIGLFPDLEGRR
jgi:hypothetical protein